MNPKMISMKQRNSIHHTRIKNSSIHAGVFAETVIVFFYALVPSGADLVPYISKYFNIWLWVSIIRTLSARCETFPCAKKKLGRFVRKTVVWNADVRGVALLRIKKTISFFKWGFLWFLIYDYLNANFCPQIVCQSDMMYKISHVA